MKMKKYIAVAGAILALTGIQSAQAMSVNVDQILAPGDVDASQLSGTVNMEASGSTLTITLQNTSTDAAGSGAGVLLTGIGFNLPGWVKITSGTATIGSGSSGVGFTGTGGDSVSQEWGYDAGGLDSGALQSTTESVNTAVSSMESQTTAQFAAGSIAQPPNLDGPDFGLVSALEQDSLGNGVEGINDSIVIVLTLDWNGNHNLDDLVSDIDASWVALTFGSPGGGTSVPDASTSLMLLGLAMVGIESVRRKMAR